VKACPECTRLRRDVALLREALSLAAAWVPARAEWCEWPENRRNVERVHAAMARFGSAVEAAS
jgi:hypothetical protein